MATIKEEISLDPCPNMVKIVLKRCPRTEKAVQKLQFVQNGHKNDHHPHHHPCPICGSSTTDKVNGNTTKRSPVVHVDLFKNTIFALTLEAAGGGCYKFAVDKDVQNYMCSECLAKFALLESLQNEISLLERKVEEILSQLKKTISDRCSRVVSQGNLTEVDVTKPKEATTHTHPPSLSDMDEVDAFEDSAQIMAEAENVKDEEMELKPVFILEEQEGVQQIYNVLELPNDDGIGDDPLGGVDSISNGHYPINKPENDALNIQVMAPILRNNNHTVINDDDLNDEDSPNNASDTDSDSSKKKDTPKESYKQSGTPSHPSAAELQPEIKYICTVRGKQVKNLRGHMMTTYGGQKNLRQKRGIQCAELVKKQRFICPICKDCFAKKDYLRLHIRTVHNGEKRIKCPISKCQCRFFTETNLQRHLELSHPQEGKGTFPERISCTICPQTFSTVPKQMNHIQSVHICAFCNKSFLNKADRDEHKVTHTGDRPYLCTKCGSKFTQKTSLSFHLKMTNCNPDKVEMDKMRKKKQIYKRELLSRKRAVEDCQTDDKLGYVVQVQTIYIPPLGAMINPLPPPPLPH